MKNNVYLKVLVILLILTISLITIFALIKRKSKSKINPKVTSSSPTVTLVPFINQATITNTPNNILPTFTGRLDPTFTEAFKQEIDHTQELRHKTPLIFPQFEIDYDYSSARFKVILKQPAEQNKSVFLKWLKDNYSDIPLSEFDFVNQ